MPAWKARYASCKVAQQMHCTSCWSYLLSGIGQLWTSQLPQYALLSTPNTGYKTKNLSGMLVWSLLHSRVQFSVLIIRTIFVAYFCLPLHLAGLCVCVCMCVCACMRVCECVLLFSFWFLFIFVAFVACFKISRCALFFPSAYTVDLNVFHPRADFFNFIFSLLLFFFFAFSRGLFVVLLFLLFFCVSACVCSFF